MLQARLITQIRGLLVQGDKLLDTGAFDQALQLYRKAVSLIPEPQIDHPIALDAFLALGEAFFFSGRYSDALRAFNAALKAPGGVEDSLVHLRLGETYYELGNLEMAGDELTRAYMLDRAAIFEDEDPKYYSFLSTLIDLQ